MRNPTLVTSPDDTGRLQWRPRLQAAGLHLLGSLLVAALAAALVFGLWYPWPYRELSGGRELFVLLVSVDIVLGPLITLAVFNLRKPRGELVRDLAVVCLLQLAALAFGLWTVHAARPVKLAFEYDRFRVVHLVDIPPGHLASAAAGLAPQAWRGPAPVALRPLRPGSEQVEYTMAALEGLALSARPELWTPYATQQGAVLAAARPLGELLRARPADRTLLEAAARTTGREPASLAWLPVQSRGEQAWTVLLDARTAEILAFVPLDPY